jgi:hypothetical protein
VGLKLDYRQLAVLLVTLTAEGRAELADGTDAALRACAENELGARLDTLQLEDIGFLPGIDHLYGQLEDRPT